MGEVVRFWDYKRETLPSTPWDVRAKAIGDLRDTPSARIYELQQRHESKRIYPKVKVLPPLLISDERVEQHRKNMQALIEKSKS